MHGTHTLGCLQREPGETQKPHFLQTPLRGFPLKHQQLTSVPTTSQPSMNMVPLSVRHAQQPSTMSTMLERLAIRPPT